MPENLSHLLAQDTAYTHGYETIHRLTFRQNFSTDRQGIHLFGKRIFTHVNGSFDDNSFKVILLEQAVVF